MIWKLSKTIGNLHAYKEKYLGRLIQILFAVGSVFKTPFLTPSINPNRKGKSPHRSREGHDHRAGTLCTFSLHLFINLNLQAYQPSLTNLNWALLGPAYSVREKLKVETEAEGWRKSERERSKVQNVTKAFGNDTG